MNPMQNVRIEKVTLNFGAGKEQAKLDKGVILLKAITGIDPVKTVTQKRIPSWGVRPGLPIGCMLTLRKTKASEVLKRMLEAKELTLKNSCFDANGNVSFGIAEYIDIPGVKYDPKMGVIGLQVCVTLEKPGFRIKKRKLLARKVNRSHRISKEESQEFMKKNFGVKIL